MNYKAIIFDFDGTLFDTMSIWHNIPSNYLLNKGITPKNNIDEYTKSMSMHDCCTYIINEYNLPYSVEELVSQVNAMMEHNYFYNSLPMRGVMDLIPRLYAQGIQMVIASQSSRHLIQGALSRLNLDKYFVGIVTSPEVGAGKDKPTIFYKALDILGSDISDTIVVEDSVFAIRTAKNAGFRVVGVYDEWMKNHQEEIQSLSDYYLLSLEDFI